MSDPDVCAKQQATNKLHTKTVWIIRAMVYAGEMLPIAQATGHRLALPWGNGRLLLVLARTARKSRQRENLGYSSASQKSVPDKLSSVTKLRLTVTWTLRR